MNSQDAAVDSGNRTEGTRLNTRAELEFPPRSPSDGAERSRRLRCSLSRNLPLKNEVSPRQWHLRIVQEASHDRSGLPERKRAHDSKRLPGQRKRAEIGRLNSNVAVARRPKATLEPARPDVIELDGNDVDASSGERSCDGTGARPDLQNQLTRLEPSVSNELLSDVGSKKVLAENSPSFAPRRSSTRGHGRAP